MPDDFSVATEDSCHRIGISGNCSLICPVLLDGKCDEQESMLEDLDKTNVGRVVKLAIENGEDPGTALVTHHADMLNGVELTYVKALQILKGW